jgi:hypothetical protein
MELCASRRRYALKLYYWTAAARELNPNGAMQQSKRRVMAKKKKRRYSSSSHSDVKSEMHRYKRGKAKSGRGGKGGKVKSRKQAIAIGLSKARNKGKKVPRKKK